MPAANPLAPLSPRTTAADFGPTIATMARLFLKAAQVSPTELTGRSLQDRNPALIEEMLPFFDWFYHHYFRVKTDGWEHIPPSGRMLLIGSHNGGLAAPDTTMMTYDWLRRFGVERPAYALMDPRMWRVFPPVARMGAWVGCLRADSVMAVRALRQEAALLIYPGGARDVFRPHYLRDRICFFGQKGFVKLALMEQAPIIPVISYGAHDTLRVLADFYPQVAGELQRRDWSWPWGIDPGTLPLYLGWPWGVALGPLPHLPTPVFLHTRVCAPITFERCGREAAQDEAYVDACYGQVRGIMQEELDALFALYD